MSILLEDNYLERQIVAEQQSRGDGTKARTMTSLLRERLTQLEYERRYQQSGSDSSPQSHQQSA